MNINIHIERLILDGLPVEGSDGSIVQTAVESELARLMGEGRLSRELQSAGAIASVRGGSFQFIRENNPTHLGHQIAHAISGIGQTSPVPDFKPRETRGQDRREGEIADRR